MITMRRFSDSASFRRGLNEGKNITDDIVPLWNGMGSVFHDLLVIITDRAEKND